MPNQFLFQKTDFKNEEKKIFMYWYNIVSKTLYTGVQCFSGTVLFYKAERIIFFPDELGLKIALEISEIMTVADAINIWGINTIETIKEEACKNVVAELSKEKF